MKTIQERGEFGLISRIKKMFPGDASVIRGIGDDCAVLPYTRNRYLLYTCDMLVEGVDFKKGEDPALIGRKSLAVSLSDIAACGGIPRWCLVSLGIPGRTSEAAIDAFYRGLGMLAKKYSVAIVGGDISRAPQLVIDISMIGEVSAGKLVLRSGAKVNDIIFVTGDFGGSIRGKHLRFEPRLDEAAFLVNTFKPTSMIDCSDGLSQDLGHILDASRVGAVLYEELIPVSKDASGLGDALSSGEDFELIFTMKPQQARMLLAGSPLFKPVGEIVSRKRGLSIIDNRGRQKKLSRTGYRHF
jgi:thiamine-monophosphate kinase